MPAPLAAPREGRSRPSTRAIDEGIGRGLWIMPTGTGKTVAFAALARSLDVPTLVRRPPRRTAQAGRGRPSAMSGPRTTVGTLPGEGWQESKVVAASVQSLASRLDKIDPARFGLVVADEAHHAPARNWGKALGHFQPRFRLGVTATPCRLDGKPLDAVFGSVVYRYGLGEAIRDGRIVPLRQKAVHTGVRLRVEAGQDGRCPERRLAQVAATQARAEAVADGYLTRGEGRQALFFAGDLEAVGQIGEALATRGGRGGSRYGSHEAPGTARHPPGLPTGPSPGPGLLRGADGRLRRAEHRLRRDGPSDTELGLVHAMRGPGPASGRGGQDGLPRPRCDRPALGHPDVHGGGPVRGEAPGLRRQAGRGGGGGRAGPLPPGAAGPHGTPATGDGTTARMLAGRSCPPWRVAAVPSRRWPATARQLKAIASYGLEPARADHGGRGRLPAGPVRSP